MNKDLKDQRRDNRFMKTLKMPFRRIIRIFDADLWMRSKGIFDGDMVALNRVKQKLFKNIPGK